MDFQPLTVPASLDSLDEIARYVVAASEKAGLDERPAYRLRLAVDEVATNIILHGYSENNRSGEIKLQARINPDTLVISTEDTAPPFDPRQQPPPNLALPVEKRPAGGLGVFLALQSVDEFKYERAGDRNINTLVINRNSPSGTDNQSVLERMIMTGQDVKTDTPEKSLQEIDTFNENAWQTLSTSPTEAFELASKALDLSSEKGYEKGMAYAWRTCAAARWMSSESAEALANAQKALTLFQKLEDHEGEIDVLSIFAAIYGSLSEYEAALDYQLKALGIAEDTGNKPGLTKALFNIGTIYYLLGQYQTALDYQLRCAKIDWEIGDENHMASTLSSIGGIYLKLGDMEAALDYQLKALDMAGKVNNRYELAYIYQNLGRLYEKQQKTGEAIKYFMLALDTFEKLGNRVGEAETLQELGSLYIRSGQYQEAENNLGKALQIGEETLARDLVYKVHEAYSALYEALGNFPEALKHFKLYSEIKNEVINSDNQKTIAGMQIRFNYEKVEKDREIMRLRNVELASALQELETANREIAVLNEQLQAEMKAVKDELQIGRQIQSDFLPETLPPVTGWELSARFKPAREVSGDFYDAFLLPNNRVGIVIADVCDKGVGAALFMSLTRSLVRVLALQAAARLAYNAVPAGAKLLVELPGNRPGEPSYILPADTVEVLGAVTLANDYITENHSRANMFATLFFGVLDTETGLLCYINGGHDAPVHLGNGGIKGRLTLTGPAVGAIPGVRYKMRQVQLEPGDTLLTYTDGIPEARAGDGSFFTEQKLLALLEESQAAGGEPLQELLDRISREVEGHVAGADPSDDITILAVRRLPA